MDEHSRTTDGVTCEAIPSPSSHNGPTDAAAFVFRNGDTTLTVVVEDAREFPESRLPGDLDAVVVECGGFDHAPDGTRRPVDAVPPANLTHEEMRERIRRVDPDRALFSHIGHQYARSYDDCCRLERESDESEFVHDGLIVDI